LFVAIGSAKVKPFFTPATIYTKKFLIFLLNILNVFIISKISLHIFFIFFWIEHSWTVYHFMTFYLKWLLLVVYIKLAYIDVLFVKLYEVTFRLFILQWGSLLGMISKYLPNSNYNSPLIIFIYLIISTIQKPIFVP